MYHASHSLLTASLGGNAVISLIFAEYLNRLFWHATKAEVSPDDIPQWAIKLTAIAAVLVVSTICVATPTLGTRTAVVFTTVKVRQSHLPASCRPHSVPAGRCLGMPVPECTWQYIDTLNGQVSITILGIVQLARGRASTSLTESLFTGSSTSPSSYALALYSGLWAFDGWDQANYVGGEMKNAQKNIPRAIHISMLLVTVSAAVSPMLRDLTVSHRYSSCLPTWHTS